MELAVVIVFIAVIYYWLDSIRAKEMATKYARIKCKDVLLEFLDDTVLIKKVRLRRNLRGQLSVYREYEFEFSSTGDHRYKGQVQLLGQTPINLHMEPYKFDSEEVN